MPADGLLYSSQQSDAEVRQALAPQWKARALRAIQLGDAWQAWLWADTLCRRTRGPSRADAFMLRSVALAMQGDGKAANDDMLTAAQLDPDSVPLNRMLLGATELKTRIVAAAALLRADTPDDRRRGMSTLSRSGFGCAGTAKLQGQQLVLDLAWNGRRHLSLLIKTDAGEQSIEIAAGTGQKVEGFSYAATSWIDLPAGASAVNISVRNVKAIVEPRTFVLRKDFSVDGEAVAAGNAELLIVIPVYEDREATMACLEALFVALPREPLCRVVVVDDASPNIPLSEWLQERADEGRIHLIRNVVNMGFAASVNRAIEMRRAGQDVLLLNSDTIVPEGAIEALARHLRNDERIGTVTPLSNNGEDTSFPQRFRANPLPSPREIGELQRIASRVNRAKAVDMPNGVGFCLYIRGSLFDELGALSLEFDRGYFEDVEFSLRAAAAGYKNICAADVYVGHHGSRSFGMEKRTLVSRNLKRLSAVHGGYRAASESFQRVDPLRELIGRIEEEFLRVRAEKTHLLIIPHDTPAVLAATLERQKAGGGGRLIVIRVTQRKGLTQLFVRGADNAGPQNIAWSVAMGRDGEVEIARRLREMRVKSATILDVDALPIDVAKAVSTEAADIEFFVAASYQRVAKGRGAIRKLLPSRRAIKQASVVAATAAIDDVLSRLGNGMRSTIANVADFATMPQLKVDSGILAIVGMRGSVEDHALVRALAVALPGDTEKLCVICSGAGLSGEPPDRVHFAGKVADEDLAAWLTQLRAQAILFADRKWGIADPRAAAWAQRGLAVACFGHAPAAVAGTPFVLSDLEKPQKTALEIARWLDGQAG